MVVENKKILNRVAYNLLFLLTLFSRDGYASEVNVGKADSKVTIYRGRASKEINDDYNPSVNSLRIPSPEVNIKIIEDWQFEDLRPRLIINALDGSKSYVITEDEKKFTETYAQKTEHYSNRTSLGKGYDLIKSSTAAVAKGVFKVGAWSTDKVLHYGTAYLTSYYAEDTVIQGMSLAARGGVTLATGNPVAGKVIGDGIMGIYKIAQYVPGARGAVACMVTPLTKVATDLTIDYGPYTVIKVAKTGYNTLSSTASAFSRFSSNISNK